MPLPAEAGSLSGSKDLLNIRDESWPLILGWLVCALMPGLAVPILLFLGEQGSAKSTAGRLVSGLVDPSPAPLRRAPTDVRDWVAQASASHVVVLDNITEIKPWFQDCLCRAVTGEGSVDRTLFTNLDVTVTAFQRAVCLTSISAGPVHGDLAGRLLPVELDPIADDCRKEDAAIMAEFALYRPAILAGLFNVVAAVLNQLPRVRPDNLPRMADFGRHLAAIDVVMGWESLKAYRASVDDALRSVVADDPVAQAVVALVKAQPESALKPAAEEFAEDKPGLFVAASELRPGRRWKGTATDLLHALVVPDPRPKEWPAIAGHLGAS